MLGFGGSSDTAEKLNQSATDLGEALEELHAKIREEKRICEQRARDQEKAGWRPTFAVKSGGPGREELAMLEAENAERRMLKSIVTLHSKLRTGIVEQNVLDDSRVLEEFMEKNSGKELDNRIRLAMLQGLHSRIASEVWTLTNSLMQRAGHAWPEPGGLLPGASEAQKERTTLYHMQEAESHFAALPLEKTIKGMRGKQSAWKAYPEEGGWLWEEMVILGVASGIRGELVRIGLERLRTESEELRSRARIVLAENLSRVQALLSSGVRSLDDAERAAESAEEIVQQFLPELAWEYARPAIAERLGRFAA
jgi:hypothetical protein